MSRLISTALTCSTLVGGAAASPSPAMPIQVTDRPASRPTHAVKHYFSDRSQRWWATTAVCGIAGLVVLSQLSNIFGAAPTQTVAAPSENRQLAMFADTQHPLANLGDAYDAYPDADSAQKLDLIFQALENFDYWLKPRLNTAMGDALAKKALEMQGYAQREAHSGQYTTTDALNLFDFHSCLTKLPGDRCVLLRYAGEGIRDYAQASAAGDVYAMSAGYLKMRAALLALGDFEIASNAKEDVPLNALANYRAAIYLGLQHSPAAIAPVKVELPETFGDTTPAEALEQAYSNTRSSEPIQPEAK